MNVNPYYHPDSDFSESRDFFVNSRENRGNGRRSPFEPSALCQGMGSGGLRSAVDVARTGDPIPVKKFVGPIFPLVFP
jgi:hypothetical protein